LPTYVFCVEQLFVRNVYLLRYARPAAVWLFLLIGFMAASRLSGATYYNFQDYHGNTVSDGVVGKGTLQFSNSLGTVRGNFIKGGGSFMDFLVLFIDSTAGGFDGTRYFNESDGSVQTAVSGYYGTKRSVANFAPGFFADYAIVLGVDNPGYLYKLVNDGTGPHLELVRSSLNFQNRGVPNAPSFSFDFSWADIGLTNANTNFFKFESTYIKATGYRTLESFEGLIGSVGYSTITFTNYDTYGVPPVPECADVALAIFGGILVVAGLGTRARRRKISWENSG